MRSAVFLPTPGNAHQPIHLAAPDGANQIRRRQAGEHLHRQLGPDAAHPDQLFEQRLFVRREKAVERQRVFANVRVDAQPHLRAGIGQMSERRDRDDDVIADAAGFDDRLVGMLLDQNAAQQSNHE